jgi:hypothetical protein
MKFSGSIVAEIIFQPHQRFLIVTLGFPVNDVQTLSSMCVEKMQAVIAARDDLSL